MPSQGPWDATEIAQRVHHGGIARVFGHGDLILRKTWTSICERYATLNDALVLRLVKVDLFFQFE